MSSESKNKKIHIPDSWENFLVPIFQGTVQHLILQGLLFGVPSGGVLGLFFSLLNKKSSYNLLFWLLGGAVIGALFTIVIFSIFRYFNKSSEENTFEDDYFHELFRKRVERFNMYKQVVRTIEIRRLKNVSDKTQEYIKVGVELPESHKNHKILAYTENDPKLPDLCKYTDSCIIIIFKALAGGHFHPKIYGPENGVNDNFRHARFYFHESLLSNKELEEPLVYELNYIHKDTSEQDNSYTNAWLPRGTDKLTVGVEFSESILPKEVQPSTWNINDRWSTNNERQHHNNEGEAVDLGYPRLYYEHTWNKPLSKPKGNHAYGLSWEWHDTKKRRKSQTK